MLFDNKPAINKTIDIAEVQKFLTFKKNDYKMKFEYGKNAEQLKQAFRDIEVNDCIQFVTNGAWSMFDMIDYFLRMVGKSKIHLTSWAVSEQAARKIDKLHEEGYIESLTCLFDYRIKDRKSEPIALLERFGKVHLTKIHAKVIVLESEKMCITVNGSGNLSKNLRIEAGTIFCCQDSANFHKSWIIKESEVILIEKPEYKKYLQSKNLKRLRNTPP